jgi:hypothetical protein
MVAVPVWSVPAYLTYVQPPLTKAVARAAEAALKVKLPRAYLDILAVQNGGYLHRRTAPDEKPPVDFIAGIGPRFPSLPMSDWAEVKQEMAEAGLKKPKQIDGLIPFSGDGHYYYCFDYRKAGRRAEPRVSYVDVETFSTDVVVARDFASFLASLESDHGTALGLHTRGDIKKVAREVSAALGRKLTDVGGGDLYGYPLFTAALSGGEFARLQPNRVRRGFARKREPDFAKLSKLMPGEADRFPQYADCGYFLTTTADQPIADDAALIKKLAKLPFAFSVVDLDRSA